MRQNINGILLLDKPLGMSSNAILQRVKYLFNAKKAGHTGSLDPLATGMLPICFGEATKFSQILLDSDKTYDVVGKLGERTTTGDKEGTIIATHPVSDMTKEKLEQVTAQFLGDIEQIPPMFSALKVQGKPLYELARKGIEIERKSRKITIHKIEIQRIDQDSFAFQVHCSKGTYVRTLVEDIGNALGCGAHVAQLRRVGVSPYGLSARMYHFSELQTLTEQGADVLQSCLLSVDTAVQMFPSIHFNSTQVTDLQNGKRIRTTLPFESVQLVRLISDNGHFFGMGEITAEGNIKPQRLLNTSLLRSI